MKKRTGCFLISGLLLLLLLCGGAAAWWYLSSQSQGTRAFVQIRAPQTGALTEVNATLPLMVYAEASRPVLRLEVYADGALVAAANGQENALTLVQPWTPLTPGRHVLVARAFFSADDFADSQAVFVDTADLSGVPIEVNVDAIQRGEGVTEIRVGDLAAAAGTTPAEIARLNPGLPSAPEAVIPPGTPLNLPRRPNPPPSASSASPSVPSSAPSSAPAVPPPAPGAPGTDLDAPPASRFNGETHSCSQASMRWTDAPDETSYRLYRLAPGEDRMSLLVTLPANTLTYTDPLTRVGTYRYFLAPVRPRGEMVTSMLNVEIGPECSPAGTGTTTALNLLLLSLTTEQAYDGVYCYVSFNGSRYERLPAEPGLLRPTSGGLYYELPLQLPSRGLYPITVPSDGLVRLDGECWGRRGAQSLSLGRFSGSHARGEWDGRDLLSEVRAFAPRELASVEGLPAEAGGASFVRYRFQPAGSRFDLSNIAPGVLRSVYLNMPVILQPLEGGNDSFIPAPTNLQIRRLIGCPPFISIQPIAGEYCRPLPALTWDWNGNRNVSEDDLTGWIMAVHSRNYSQSGAAWEYVTSRIVEISPAFPASRREMNTPGLPRNLMCGVELRVKLMALTRQGNSLPSAPLIVRQPPCSTVVKVNLQSIQLLPRYSPLGPTDDVIFNDGEENIIKDIGDICIFCNDVRLEIFGGFGANGVLTSWAQPSHGAGTTLFGNCPEDTVCLTQGRYSNDDPRSRRALVSFFYPTYSVAAPSEGTGLTLNVYILDYDTEKSSRDNLCVASKTLPPRSAAEWERINQDVQLASNYGEAGCIVTLRVQGARDLPSP